MKKTLKVTDPAALASMAAILAIHAAASKEQDAIQARAQDEANRAAQIANAKMDAEWQTITMAAGIPPEEASKWQMDPQYLEEHGIGFLRPKEVCGCGVDHDGLAALLGLAPGVQKH